MTVPSPSHPETKLATKGRAFDRRAIFLGFLLVGLLLGWLLHSVVSKPARINGMAPPDQIIQARPGPWGDVESLRISISSPEEFLTVQRIGTNTPAWFFKGYTRESLTELAGALNFNADQKDDFILRSRWEPRTNGISVAPNRTVILSLSPHLREQLYTILAQFPENVFQADPLYFRADTFKKLFEHSGVHEATIALIHKLSYRRGDYLYFSDLPLVMQTLPDFQHRLTLKKALSRNYSLLVKLRVRPDSDINALARYWSKGGRAKDVRPLLESMAEVPGGARLDIVHLLPPFARGRLYTYPFPSHDPIVAQEDCFWTSFNFFRDPPDSRYCDLQFVGKSLELDCYPVLSDPAYGDLVVLTRPGGQVLHAAVYLADDIVYTKNGAHFLQPWMLATISDLLDVYSGQIPPEEQLKVTYYRNKYY